MTLYHEYCSKLYMGNIRRQAISIFRKFRKKILQAEESIDF